MTTNGILDLPIELQTYILELSGNHPEHRLVCQGFKKIIDLNFDRRWSAILQVNTPQVNGVLARWGGIGDFSEHVKGIDAGSKELSIQKLKRLKDQFTSLPCHISLNALSFYLAQYSSTSDVLLSWVNQEEFSAQLIAEKFTERFKHWNKEKLKSLTERMQPLFPELTPQAILEAGVTAVQAKLKLNSHLIRELDLEIDRIRNSDLISKAINEAKDAVQLEKKQLIARMDVLQGPDGESDKGEIYRARLAIDGYETQGVQATDAEGHAIDGQVKIRVNGVYQNVPGTVGSRFGGAPLKAGQQVHVHGLRQKFEVAKAKGLAAYAVPNDKNVLRALVRDVDDAHMECKRELDRKNKLEQELLDAQARLAMIE